MPKELMHWYTAAKAAEILGGPQQRILTSLCSADYFLGAVSLDTLYYSPSKRQLQYAADCAHGKHGENTYGFLLEAVEAIESFSEKVYPIYAFLCGVLAHIAADSVFHPLVYYYCGIQDATERHWLFETRMDLAVQDRVKVRSYRKLLSKSQLERRDFFRLLRVLFAQPLADDSVHDGSSQEAFLRAIAVSLNSCVRRFSIIQALFRSASAACVFTTMSHVIPRLGRYLALSYVAQRHRNRDAFASVIPYVHPATGREETVRLDELVERAAKLAAGSSAALWSVLCEPKKAERRRMLQSWCGPSLETGLIGSTKDFMAEMKHVRSDLFGRLFPDAP